MADVDSSGGGGDLTLRRRRRPERASERNQAVRKAKWSVDAARPRRKEGRKEEGSDSRWMRGGERVSWLQLDRDMVNICVSHLWSARCLVEQRAISRYAHCV